MKKILSNQKTTGILLIAAIVILALSTVQTSRAALNYVSENYTAEISMKDIGVQILENGTKVSGDDGLLNWINEEIKPGMLYDEKIALKNSGTIDEYVRASVYRYWEKDSVKQTNLDPGLIVLSTGNEWIEDAGRKTAERSVFYYTKKLGPEGITGNLIEGIKIDGNLPAKVSQTTEGNTIITSYDYDGLRFVIEVEANAVQTHSAESAIKSAWGIDVSIDGDGSLRIGG